MLPSCVAGGHKNVHMGPSLQRMERRQRGCHCSRAGLILRKSSSGVCGAYVYYQG